MLSNTLKSIKTSVDLIKEYAEAKAFSDLYAEITVLQKTCLEAYSMAFELQEKYREAQEKYLEAENWENQTAPDYKLAELAPGVFVYALKSPEKRNEPGHNLCANCFHKKRKSILQRAGRDVAGTRYHCPECKTDLLDPAGKAPFNVAASGDGRVDRLLKDY